ncbi:histidine kinase N-terminal 7TM domain-containing diguanylate cyclase [Sporosalibacterium faouarense]|uniref:histidine kinase N-terminal 7TM domain-containing diguanylate cyclase n=1 Tax=Sporosalibacterium faouarense TaxID=516123 RepID=UPI00141C366F|nr:diguanylate cyclase [Sporosalibacterium faouarense]MTI46299.1 diguanylate cyclase [Bacillota bacterium]
MEYNYVYSIICLASSILVLSLSLLGRVHYKSTSYSKPFSYLMLFSGIYTFGYGFEIIKGDPSWIFFWLRVEYVGISFIAACWLWLSMDFTKKDKYLKLPFFVLIFGVSMFFLISVLTNSLHHLFYSYIKIIDSGYFKLADLGKGPLYIAHSVWLFICFIISSIMYILYYLRSTTILKKQAAIMVIISIEIIISSVFDLSGFAPWGVSVDIGPMIITANGCICAYIIFKAGILNISPIAREKVFESMREGVIVTDLNGVIADFNPAAQYFLPKLSKKWIGERLLNIVPQFEKYTDDYGPLEIEPFVLEDKNEIEYYEIRQVPVMVNTDKRIGTAWYMKQITGQYKLVERLKEYAEIDELTGIFNRRKWTEMAENEMKRANRYKKTFSIMLIDIDYFKRVNDTMGHEIGDKVLANITNTISNVLRSSDIFGRLGGEEFAIIFPETNKEEVSKISERLLEEISNNIMVFEAKKFTVTISAGVSVCENGSNISLEELLRKADEGLYKAKNNGRNRVCFT